MSSTLPIIINPSIVTLILKYYMEREINDTRIALSLYMHLYYTSRMQNNVQVWAKDVYLMGGLGIGKTVLVRVKADLVRLGLIKYIYHRENGKVKNTYIKVNHIWGRAAINKLTGKTDSLILEMAKRYLLDVYLAYDPICKVNDIFLPSFNIDGVDHSFVGGDIYISDDDIINVYGKTDQGAEMDYTFSAEDAANIYMQVYYYVTDQ